MCLGGSRVMFLLGKVCLEWFYSTQSIITIVMVQKNPPLSIQNLEINAL